MTKSVQPSKFSNSVGRKVQIKTFPGTTIADMKHYVQPTLRLKPRTVVRCQGDSKKYEVLMPRYSN